MKICYVCCSSKFGGLENVVVQTLNELCKHFEIGVVVPNNSDYINKFHKKVSIYEYQSKDSRYNPFLYIEFYKILATYDIIHTHGAKATKIVHILNMFLKKRFVATKHNARKGKIFNKVKNVISVSKAVANSITHPSKVLYFGIKEDKIKPFSLSNKFSIISIGRLDFIKGFDELIRVASTLEFEYELFIVGEGEERQNLLDLIDSLNLKDRVKLLGFQNNINELLKGANLHIISSRNEGFPLILLESIFYSNLLISTNVGGICEAIDERYLTNLKNLKEKVEFFYNNYEIQSKEYRKMCDIHKSNFTFQKYINGLVAYYGKLQHTKR